MSDTLASYTTTIGNGHSTLFTIYHHLHSATPLVSVYDKDLNLVCAVVTVSTLESVCVDTGDYLGVSNYYHFGPFKIPRWNSKLLISAGTIPALDSLHVQVVA
jgi:hypothetical protein